MENGSSKRAPRAVPVAGRAFERIARILILRRDALLIVGVILVAALTARAIWLRVRADVFRGSEYQLSFDDVEITPPPSWIRGNVKAEALRDGSLDEPLSLIDENLTERIAKAFALHPWVARVERVTKHYPAGASVDLVYRRPVAMVEVQDGLFPVDSGGVLLPSADFTAAEARNYPRIADVTSQPMGPVGTSWNDASVTGAARIAEVLSPIWRELRLYQIRLRPDASQSRAEGGEFHLITRTGNVIPWGNPPGDESPPEPNAADKIARLKKYAVEHGGLDNSGNVPDLDLRLQAGARTAHRGA